MKKKNQDQSLDEDVEKAMEILTPSTINMDNLSKQDKTYLNSLKSKVISYLQLQKKLPSTGFRYKTKNAKKVNVFMPEEGKNEVHYLIGNAGAGGQIPFSELGINAQTATADVSKTSPSDISYVVNGGKSKKPSSAVKAEIKARKSAIKSIYKKYTDPIMRHRKLKLYHADVVIDGLSKNVQKSILNYK
ncbi:MAG: hypothetical protein ABH828_04620 [archaeon]